MHRRNWFIGLLCLLGIFMLTSCFDVVEEVNMKNNGSGSIKAMLNASKSKTKVASLLKLDKIDTYKVPSEADIRRELSTVVHLLKSTPGITNVEQRLDMQNFIASISCDFADVKALNTFTATLSKHFKIDIGSYSSYVYDSKSKTLVRGNQYNANAKEGFEKLSVESRRSFLDAFYTSIYRFDSEISAVSNSQAKISPNRRAVMLKTNLPDLINGKTDVNNRITLK